MNGYVLARMRREDLIQAAERARRAGQIRRAARAANRAAGRPGARLAGWLMLAAGRRRSAGTGRPAPVGRRPGNWPSLGGSGAVGRVR
jgi:hypothetical protein